MIQLSTQSPTGLIPGVRAAGFPLGTTSDFALALADLAGATGGISAPAGPPGLTVASAVPKIDVRPILAGVGKDLPGATGVVAPDPSIDPSPIAPVIPAIAADSATQPPIPDTIAGAPRVAMTAPERSTVDVAIALPLARPTIILAREPTDDASSPVPSADPVIAGTSPLLVADPVATPAAPVATTRSAPTRRVPVAPPAILGLPTGLVAPPIIVGAGQVKAGDSEPTTHTPEAEDAILPIVAPTTADPIVTPDLPTPTPVVLADTPPVAATERTAPAVARSMPILSPAGPAASPSRADATAGAPSVLPTAAPPVSVATPSVQSATPIASPAPTVVATAPTTAAATPKRATSPTVAMPVFTQPGAIVTPQAVSGIRVPSAITVAAKASATKPATPAGAPVAARTATVPTDPAVALPMTARSIRTPAILQAVADIPVAAAIVPGPAASQGQSIPAAAGIAPPHVLSMAVAPAPVTAPVAHGIVNTDTARTIDTPATVTVTVVALPATPAPLPQTQPAAQAFAAAMFAAAEPFDARASDSADDLPFGLVAAAASTALQAPTTVVPGIASAQQPALDLTKSDWMASMIDRIETLRDESGGVRETRMKLAPEALGTIEVSVRRDEQGVMQVRIAADTPQARALLADAAPKLAEMAEARGVKLGGSSVDSNSSFADQGRRDAQAVPAQRRALSAAANDTTDTTTDSRLA